MNNAPAIDIPWGAIVTVLVAGVSGFLYLLQRVWNSVSKDELAAALTAYRGQIAMDIKALEDRQERALLQVEARVTTAVESIRKTMMDLHDDNRKARHEQGDRINAPLISLGAEVMRLREILEQKR